MESSGRRGESMKVAYGLIDMEIDQGKSKGGVDANADVILR